MMSDHHQWSPVPDDAHAVRQQPHAGGHSAEDERVPGVDGRGDRSAAEVAVLRHAEAHHAPRGQQPLEQELLAAFWPQGEETVVLKVGVNAGPTIGEHHDELWEELREEVRFV